MKCSNCQALNNEGATQCRECGQVLAPRCPTCGADVAGGSRFCGQCGASLGQVSSEARPEPSRSGTQRGERRQLTVMFCDLVESTALSERLDPEDLLEVVRRYQGVVAEVVERYLGHVAQYLGDGLLIYFGYPEAHEDDPRRAVTSGLEIVQALGRLNEALEAERGVAIAVRIAVHTGDVVAAELGAGENLALGATPNVAARVQGIADPGEVLMTEATHARVARFFECSSLGPHTLRGLKGPVVLYRALEPVRSDATQQSAPAERTPFVGRDIEIEAIVERFDRARAGRGQVVLIRAEAGFGKSRLQQEARRRLADDGEGWLTCSCSPYHQNTSLYAMADFVEQLVEIEPRDEPTTRLAKLETRLQALNIATNEAVPLLGGLLSLPTDAYEASALSPDRQRQRTFELLFDMVRLSGPTPVVFSLEDLHWADPSTLEFLGQFVDRIASEPVLAILTFRPEFEVPWSSRSHQLTLDLPRLTEHDAEQIVSAWQVSRGLGDDLSREVVSRADGVPLFLEELTKALLDAINADGDVDRASARLIPNTLRDSLTARLDALGAAKEVAQLGALLGREFRFETLEAISSLDPATLRLHLTRVVDSGLLGLTGEVPRATFTFKHALVQESAYDSLLRTRRRELHDQVIDVLTDRFPAVVAGEPETIARHCEAAGRFAEASTAWQRAATRASGQWAYVEASRSFRKALSMLERTPAGPARDERELDLLVALRQPLTATEGYAAAGFPAIHSRIRYLARTLGDKVDEFSLVYASWGFHCVHSDRQETLDARDEVLDVAARSGQSPKRMIAGWVGGATDFYDGHHARALQQLDPIVDAYRKDTAGTETAEGMTAGVLFLGWLVQGWSLSMSGHLRRSLTTLRDAVLYAERLGGPFDLLQALSHQDGARLAIGSDLDEIRESTVRLLALAREHKLPQALQEGRLRMGWLAATGEDDSGIEEMRDAINITRAMGSRISLPFMLHVLADALARVGRSDEALVVADEALRASSKGIARFYEPPAHQIKGELLWKLGDRRAGEAQLRRSLEVATEQGARTFELRAATALARLLRDDDRSSAGRARLAQVCDWFEGQPVIGHLAEAKTLLEQLPTDDHSNPAPRR